MSNTAYLNICGAVLASMTFVCIVLSGLAQDGIINDNDVDPDYTTGTYNGHDAAVAELVMSVFSFLALLFLLYAISSRAATRISVYISIATCAFALGVLIPSAYNTSLLGPMVYDAYGSNYSTYFNGATLASGPFGIVTAILLLVFSLYVLRRSIRWRVSNSPEDAVLKGHDTIPLRQYKEQQQQPAPAERAAQRDQLQSLENGGQGHNTQANDTRWAKNGSSSSAKSVLTGPVPQQSQRTNSTAAQWTIEPRR